MNRIEKSHIMPLALTTIVCAILLALFALLLLPSCTAMDGMFDTQHVYARIDDVPPGVPMEQTTEPGVVIVDADKLPPGVETHPVEPDTAPPPGASLGPMGWLIGALPPPFGAIAGSVLGALGAAGLFRKRGRAAVSEAVAAMFKGEPKEAAANINTVIGGTSTPAVKAKLAAKKAKPLSSGMSSSL